MPLGYGGDLSTLTAVRNHVAKWLGVTAYTNLDADEQTFVDDEIAKALDRIAREAHWTWLEREAQFTTIPPYSTGTVTTTAGSATVTGSGTLWVANVAVNDHFALGTSTPGAYRIATVPSNTSLTLAAAFPTTYSTGQSYTTVRDEYALTAGVMWIRTLRELNSAYPVRMLSFAEFVAKTGGVYQKGRPEVALILGSDPSASGASGIAQKIQLWPAPDARYAYTYTYTALPTFPSAGGSNFEAAPQAVDMIIHAVLHAVFWRRGDLPMAGAHEAHYRQLLDGAKNIDVQRSGITTYAFSKQWARHGGRMRPNVPYTYPDY